MSDEERVVVDPSVAVPVRRGGVAVSADTHAAVREPPSRLVAGLRAARSTAIVRGPVACLCCFFGQLGATLAPPRLGVALCPWLDVLAPG